MQKMEKNLERLRGNNQHLIKGTQNSERNAHRKDQLKRDRIVKEVEAETEERLMKKIIQPKLHTLQLEQKSVEQQRNSVREPCLKLILKGKMV